MERRYTLKRNHLGSDQAEILGKCLTMGECETIIREKGIGPFEWYKIQHRNPEYTVDVWGLSDLPSEKAKWRNIS